MSRKTFLIGAIGLCALVAIPFAASTTHRKMPNAALQTTSQQDAQAPEALLFELRPAGFTPAEVTVPAGKYFLILQNRSGLRDLSFKLERDNEDNVASSNQQQRDWKRTVQLASGTYMLSEASHAEWRSVIHVTSR